MKSEREERVLEERLLPSFPFRSLLSWLPLSLELLMSELSASVGKAEGRQHPDPLAKSPWETVRICGGIAQPRETKASVGP